MSASDKKRLRKEQNAAAMTERQKAEQKEAKKLKTYTLTFWVVIILCVSIVAGLFLQAPVETVLTRYTHAITVGNHELKAVELNYFYIDTINNYVNKNQSWISYLLNVNKPIARDLAI